MTMLDIRKYSEIEKPLDCSPSKGRKIEYIVLHYTAGIRSTAGSARATCSWWNKDPGQASADFVVDDEEIWQYNLDVSNYYCWHCGSKVYGYGNAPMFGRAKNSNSIGIEMCSYRDDRNAKATAEAEGWQISDRVIRNTVELVDYLCRKYGISRTNVVTHFDVNGKLCPRPFVTRDAKGSWSIVDKYMEPFRTDKSNDSAEVARTLAEYMSDHAENDPAIYNFEVSRYCPKTNAMGVVGYAKDLTKLADYCEIATISRNYSQTDDYVTFTTSQGVLYVVRLNSTRIFG